MTDELMKKLEPNHKRLDELNKIHEMLSSRDVEMQNLGLSLVSIKTDLGHLSHRDKICIALSKVASEAYQLGADSAQMIRIYSRGWYRNF